MNPINLLARLMGRTPSSVVSQLYTHAIGQPLLIHPQMGEALIRGYMSGAVDARPPTMELAEIAPARDAKGKAEAVAVINVSGALVNRPIPGECGGPGPMSYTEIRTAFDEAMASPEVNAIVLRMESPGGMVAGCFELAEHIRDSRGTKPIYASLDNYAYSAAFALAVAADEIWATRTAGAGSVGVVGYHVDESAKLSGEGVKVTAVFSGAHKIDFAAHQPLSDSVRDRMQIRMDSLRGEFAQFVADARGIEVAGVLATEAMTYEGKDAITAGFADHIGTFRDLMAHIAAGPAKEEPAAVTPAMGINVAAEEFGTADDLAAALAASLSAKQPEPEAVADPMALLAEAVAASTLPPELSIALLKTKPQNADSPAAAIEYAQSIRDLCVAAGVPSLAADFISSAASIESARSQLLDLRAASGPEITTSIPQAAAPVAKPSIHESVYSRLRAAAAGNGQ